MGTGVSLGGRENVLKLIVVMVTKLCEYTKKKSLNCTLLRGELDTYINFISLKLLNK